MSSRVLLATRVAASPQRAFQVFVDDIGLWWQHNDLFRTSANAAGTLSFEGTAGGELVEISPSGERYRIGRVLAWEPPERLLFSWRQPGFPPDLVTEVEVRFAAAGDGATRVSVEHRGFTRVPDDSAARHGFPDAALQMRLAEWWRSLLDRFSARCPPR